MSATPVVSAALLRDSIRGEAYGLRVLTRLQPLGGPGDKVYPPTYEGGTYAVERRQVPLPDGSVRTADTVLLDSVQSQANRLESALQGARDRGQLAFPLVTVDFAGTPAAEMGRISALQAPHRIADAILRDSTLDGVPFRESTTGRQLDDLGPRNATPLLELCPSALLFGLWDSTGPRGGMGAKVQRALVSEVVAYDAVQGVRSSSRLDPLQVSSKVEVWRTPGGYTLEKPAARDAKKLKPSELNHGNVTPSLANEEGQGHPGGFTFAYAQQTTVLSFPALRRLHFPGGDDRDDADRDLAGRVFVAALGVAAVALLRREGYDLRSRCALVPAGPPVVELLSPDGDRAVSLHLDDALQAVAEARSAAEAAGFGPLDRTITLAPSELLVGLVARSRQLALAQE